MNSAPVPLETLLAHREWVRAVARAVVRDPDDAADVEQETWLAALRSPPRNDSSPRGWLGAVTRSRARRIARTDSRREARESAVARGGAAPSAGELAEIADAHRRVVQAVVELDEPYRGAILLRYFEGLSIEDVAERTASPVATARSRIRRGVATLRERLTRELGTERRPWHLALAPLVREGTPAAGAGVTGGAVMATKTTWAWAALLLGGLGVVVVARAWPDAADRNVAAAPPPPTSESAAATPTPRKRAHDAAAPSAVDATPAPRDENAASAQERSVEERLRDRVDPLEINAENAFGRLADATRVPIVLSAEAAELLAKVPRGVGIIFEVRHSGADMLESATKTFGLGYVVEKDRVVVTPPDKRWDASRPVVVVPRPAPVADVAVLGRVTDAEGRIVVGAEIVQVLSEDIRRGVTDVAGRYEIRLRRPLGMVEARAAGHATSLALPVKAEPGAQFTADLVLRGPAGSLRVKATSDAGPVAGAVVLLGASEESSRRPADGRPVQRRLDARTDDAGVAVFEGLPAGTVAVGTYVKGFEHVAGKADVVAGQAVEIALKLVPPAPVKDRLTSSRVSATFKDTSVGDATHYLCAVSKVTIIIDPALAARIDGRNVTLDVRDVPLSEALDALCREIGGAKYDVRDEVVWITVAR